jgi:hypothetical protein
VSLEHHENPLHQQRLHRFAIQLYETLVERYGIHHEQAQLALRLVEATNPDGSDVAVSIPSSHPPHEHPQVAHEAGHLKPRKEGKAGEAPSNLES